MGDIYLFFVQRQQLTIGKSDAERLSKPIYLELKKLKANERIAAEPITQLHMSQYFSYCRGPVLANATLFLSYSFKLINEKLHQTI